MRIWLDDKREMPDGFDIWCKDAKDITSYIETGRVTHISFDHDLGDGLTGYNVAVYIELLAYNKKIPPMTWDTHTANPVGKKSIEQAMKNSEKFWSE
jgi:hypothetical protein